MVNSEPKLAYEYAETDKQTGTVKVHYFILSNLVYVMGGVREPDYHQL